MNADDGQPPDDHRRLVPVEDQAELFVDSMDERASDSSSLSETQSRNSADMPKFQVLAYSIGHFYNDLCSSMWFTYLMIYLEKVVLLRSSRAGLLMLIGQATDALCTPLVGLLSDAGTLPQFLLKCGKRKAWHLIGTILVSTSFPLIFFGRCSFLAGRSEWWQILWFAAFIFLFQCGWASVQISHLAMIPELSSCASTRVSMNSYRYAFGVIANLAVFISMYLLLRGDGEKTIGPNDLRFFKEISIGVVGVGLVVVLAFYLSVKEPVRCVDRRISLSTETSRIVEMRWKCWFTERNFYLVALLYMFCRLFINISQVYFPFYITLARDMPKSYVAVLPMLSYTSSFVVSCLMGSSCVNRVLNRKMLFMFGAVLGVLISGLFYFTTDHLSIYLIALLMGTAQSTLLISSLGTTAQLINKNTETGAFVYGAMSFLDKLSNGVAYQVIELINPTCDAKDPHVACMKFYRAIMTFVPGACVVVIIFLLFFLNIDELGTRRATRRDREQASPELLNEPFD